MPATFVHNYPDLTLGDALEIPGVAGVGDFTISAYFKVLDYGGAATDGGSGDYPIGFAQCVTSWDDGSGVGPNNGRYLVDRGAPGSSTASCQVNSVGTDNSFMARPPRLVTRALTIIRLGTSVKFNLESTLLHESTVDSATFTFTNFRVGCRWMGAANGEFVFAQLSQWALFGEAWDNTQRDAFAAGRNNVLYRNSEDIWTVLGFDTTQLVDYRPMFDDFDDHSGNGRSVVVVGSPQFAVAGTRLRLAEIAPGAGDLLYLETEKITDSSDVGVTSYNGGLTITPPGGPPLSLDARVQHSNQRTFLWIPLDQNREDIQSNADAVLVQAAPETLNTGNLLASGLLRCFTFSEGAGRTLTDRATGGHSLATRSAGVSADLTWSNVGGPLGGRNYLHFDGVDDDAVGSDLGLITGAGARSFAFLLRTTSAVSHFFAGYGTVGDSVLAFGLGGDVVLNATTLNVGTGFGQTTPDLNDGNWHKCLVTYDGTTFRFYQDGVNTYNSTDITTVTTVLDGSFFLGQTGITGTELWTDCDMAGVWAWDHVLDATERAAFFADPYQMVDTTGTETWPTADQLDNGRHGWHNSGDLNRFTRSWGNQFSYSSDPAAMGTWTFSAVPPGSYIALAIYHADGDRTPEATYTVRDGATVVGTFTIDQRATMRYDQAVPRDGDLPENGRRVTILGPTPAPGYAGNLFAITTGATVTVTLENTDGTGVLVANLMGLRRIPQPYPSGSVLNAPTSWCTTTAGDAQALVAVPVDLPDVDRFMPFDPTAVRTMRVGYGIAYPRHDRPEPFYADRMRSAYPWWFGTDFTTDGNQDLLTMDPTTGTATRLFLAEPLQKSFDGMSIPNMKEVGDWRIRYTIITGTPVVTIELELDHGEVIGAHSTATPVGGKWVRTVSIDTRGTVHPGTANLRVRVSGGAAKVEIFGPEVPEDWTSLYHPALIDWLANRGFDTLRANPLALSFDESQIDWADAPSETASSSQVPATIRVFSIVSAGPVDRADLVPWYGAMNQSCAVLITTSAAHGIRDGDFIKLDGVSDDGNGWGITTAGGTASASILRGSARFCVRKSATEFIWLGFGPNNGEVDVANPAQCITLTDIHAITGTKEIDTGYNVPYVHNVGLCNEANIRTYHVNPPLGATDAYISTLADHIVAVLDVGKKVRLGSRGNECWNDGFPTSLIAQIWEYHTQWLYDTTGGAQGAPVGSAQGYAWLAWRLDRDRTIFRGRFVAAGRDPDDVITVLEGHIGNSAHAAQAAGFCVATGTRMADEFAVATYRNILEDNSPVNCGYVTDFAAGLGATSDASAVSLVYLGQRFDNNVANIIGHRNVLDSYLFFATRIITYEGGDSAVGFDRPGRSGTIYRHPLFYYKERSILQHQQDASGLSMEDRYMLAYADGPKEGQQWPDYWHAYQAAGTGDPSEGLNPHDMRPGSGAGLFGPAAPSQAAGARRQWASSYIGGAGVVPLLTLDRRRRVQ